MRFKLNILLLIITLVMCVSCKSTKPLPATKSTIKTITITEVVKDTVIKIEKDSSYYKAYVKCKDGKVVVIEKSQKAETTNTKKLSLPKVSIVDNVLDVSCETKAQELFLQWKLKHKNEVITIEKNTPYPVERDLTFFQNLFIWCGKIFLVLLFALALLLILKLKNITR